jgi:hypothetical protein
MTSALDGVSDRRHGRAALYPAERIAGTHWAGGCVDRRAGLDTEARGKNLFASAGDRNLIARSFSL